MPRATEQPDATHSAASADGPIRLSKRVAALLGCSRKLAEHYIEGGWVNVDGAVVEVPMEKVNPDQVVTVAADASAEPLPSMTLIYHKPAGERFGADHTHCDAEHAERVITAGNRLVPKGAERPLLKRHLSRLLAPCPIDPAVSGLVVLTQDGRIARKLSEDAKLIEQEIIVEVKEGQDAAPAGVINRLAAGLVVAGQPLPPCKVSWQNETRLRFAIKGPRPGQIGDMCAAVGLTVVTIKRIRIGRLSMAGLPLGQWRFLGEKEKF